MSVLDTIQLPGSNTEYPIQDAGARNMLNQIFTMGLVFIPKQYYKFDIVTPSEDSPVFFIFKDDYDATGKTFDDLFTDDAVTIIHNIPMLYLLLLYSNSYSSDTDGLSGVKASIQEDGMAGLIADPDNIQTYSKTMNTNTSSQNQMSVVYSPYITVITTLAVYIKASGNILRPLNNGGFITNRVYRNKGGNILEQFTLLCIDGNTIYLVTLNETIAFDYNNDRVSVTLEINSVYRVGTSLQQQQVTNYSLGHTIGGVVYGSEIEIAI